MKKLTLLAAIDIAETIFAMNWLKLSWLFDGVEALVVVVVVVPDVDVVLVSEALGGKPGGGAGIESNPGMPLALHVKQFQQSNFREHFK